MKRKILILSFLFCCTGAFSQYVTYVWDVHAMEILIANHTAQYTAFEVMKNKESSIATLQKSIAEKTTQIQFYKDKLYKSLKSVEAIVKTGKDVIYASELVADIVKYQRKMLEYANEDPTLLVVAVKTELALVNRTADLMKYVYEVAIIAADVNLMDNSQRVKLLFHVITELRLIRSLAYSVQYRMRVAKRSGVLKTLVPNLFNYTDNRQVIANQVLRDFKVKGN